MKRCFIYAAGTFYGLREPPRGGDLQIAADAGLLLCRAPWRHDRTLCSATSTRWTSVQGAGRLHPRAGREGRHRHHAGAPRGTSPRLRYLLSLRRDGRRAARPHARQPPVACLPPASRGAGLSLRPKFRLHSHRKRDAHARSARWTGASFRSSVWATAPSTSRSRGCNIRSRTGRSTAASRSA